MNPNEENKEMLQRYYREHGSDREMHHGRDRKKNMVVRKEDEYMTGFKV